MAYFATVFRLWYKTEIKKMKLIQTINELRAELDVLRREGKTIYYSLADNHVVSILNQGMEHIEEE